MRWRRRTASVATVITTLTALLFGPAASTGTAVPATPADTSGVSYGFSAGTDLVKLSSAELALQLDAVVAAGGTWLRVPFNWGLVEKQKGILTWAPLDRVVAAANARGLRILGVISYAPDWARTNTDSTAPPDDPAAFGRFAGQVVKRYGSSVNTWEIWNEPNNVDNFGGVPDAKVYVPLLKAAYTAIKSIQPGTSSTVVSGGLNRGREQAGGLLSFVQAMYAAGAKGSLDAVGIHPYVERTDSIPVADRVVLLVELAAVYGFTNAQADPRPLWFTEFGKPTSRGFTQTQQADLLLGQLDQFATLPFAGPSILYTIRDAGTDPTQDKQNFGTLLTFAGQPKVLFTRLAAR